MAFIDWVPDYSVGVGKFDDQHRKLVALINELHEGMRAKKGKEVVDKVLDGLVDYTKTHFKAEEDAFRANGYPQADVHVKQHADLLKQVGELHAKHHAGALFVTVETLEFLSSWLKNHIQKADKLYGPFLSGKVS
jgi:hemerythrin